MTIIAINPFVEAGSRSAVAVLWGYPKYVAQTV